MANKKTTAARRGETKTAERMRAEREMAVGLPLIHAKDPRAFWELMRLLARLSADVARQRAEK